VILLRYRRKEGCSQVAKSQQLKYRRLKRDPRPCANRRRVAITDGHHARVGDHDLPWYRERRELKRSVGDGCRRARRNGQGVGWYHQRYCSLVTAEKVVGPKALPRTPTVCLQEDRPTRSRVQALTPVQVFTVARRSDLKDKGPATGKKERIDDIQVSKCEALDFGRTSFWILP